MLGFKRLGSLTAILLLCLVGRVYAGPSSLLLGVGKSASVSVSAYVANAVDFDGINDVLVRSSDLTGNADGKQGTLSVWIRMDGGDGTQQKFYFSTGKALEAARESTDTFRVEHENVGATNILVITTTGTFTAGATWRHVLASWDLSVPVAHLFINDVDEEDGASVETNDTIDYTHPDHNIGGSGGSAELDGCMSEMYFNMAEFIDISIQSNRRKFIDAAGKPVSLGADGSSPTGTAPIIYLNGDSTNFETNQGTGGDFTVTGALTACSTSPTD